MNLALVCWARSRARKGAEDVLCTGVSVISLVSMQAGAHVMLGIASGPASGGLRRERARAQHHPDLGTLVLDDGSKARARLQSHHMSVLLASFAGCLLCSSLQGAGSLTQ